MLLNATGKHKPSCSCNVPWNIMPKWHTTRLCWCSECTKIFVPVDMDEGTWIDQLPAYYMPQFDWMPMVMLFIVAQNLFFMKATKKIFCQILATCPCVGSSQVTDTVTYRIPLHGCVCLFELRGWSSGVCGELSFWGAVESVTLIPQWGIMQLITIIWVGSLMRKSKQRAVIWPSQNVYGLKSIWLSFNHKS